MSIRLSSVLPILLAFILQSKVHGFAPISSPPASTELICHTTLASECYPAIFQPTEHFQRIHDDQSIPPGLHVRMNLATGLKEARLNVPEPPGTSHAELVIIDDLPPRPSIEKDDPAVEIPSCKTSRIQTRDMNVVNLIIQPLSIQKSPCSFTLQSPRSSP